MSYTPYPKRDPIKNYFPLPNEIFYLKLHPREFVIYAYLMQCENRQTFQCWPSYETIGKNVGMSENTVAKYIRSLEEKRLITTRPTKVSSEEGWPRNGTLLYTIRPIQEAINYWYERQMLEAQQKLEQQRAQQRFEAYEKERKNSSPVAS